MKIATPRVGDGWVAISGCLYIYRKGGKPVGRVRELADGLWTARHYGSRGLSSVVTVASFDAARAHIERAAGVR